MDKHQLYDLSVDLSESNNLAEQHPVLVKELDGRLKDIINGRY
jgi:hypothetical protein